MGTKKSGFPARAAMAMAVGMATGRVNSRRNGSPALNVKAKKVLLIALNATVITNLSSRRKQKIGFFPKDKTT